MSVEFQEFFISDRGVECGAFTVQYIRIGPGLVKLT
jgi:hypothetical protein